jgi:hypothetical protein
VVRHGKTHDYLQVSKPVNSEIKVLCAISR